MLEKLFTPIPRPISALRAMARPSGRRLVEVGLDHHVDVGPAVVRASAGRLPRIPHPRDTRGGLGMGRPTASCRQWRHPSAGLSHASPLSSSSTPFPFFFCFVLMY